MNNFGAMYHRTSSLRVIGVCRGAVHPESSPTGQLLGHHARLLADRFPSLSSQVLPT